MNQFIKDSVHYFIQLIDKSVNETVNHLISQSLIIR